MTTITGYRKRKVDAARPHTTIVVKDKEQAKGSDKVIGLVEYNANTTIFFLYVSYVEMQKLFIVLHQRTDAVQRSTDPRVKAIYTFCSETLAILQSAVDDFLGRADNENEKQRLRYILDEAHSSVQSLLSEQLDNIAGHYHGKFFNDPNDNISYLAAFITHIRRVLMIANKVAVDMVSKWKPLYPLSSMVVKAGEIAMAFDKMSRCYGVAMLGVNVDMTKDKRNLSIQKDLIEKITSRDFYKHCCKNANVEYR